MRQVAVCSVFMAAALAAAISDAGQSTAQGTGSSPSGVQQGAGYALQFPGKGMPQQFPGMGTQQQGGLASQMFRGLDKNGDGVVTEEEFFAPHERRFDALDANHDGKLTSKEFESRSMFGQSQQPAK